VSGFNHPKNETRDSIKSKTKNQSTQDLLPNSDRICGITSRGLDPHEVEGNYLIIDHEIKGASSKSSEIYRVVDGGYDPLE